MTPTKALLMIGLENKGGIVARKKKQPKNKKTSRKKKREIEGYYIPGDGTIKVLYKKNGGLSI